MRKPKNKSKRDYQNQLAKIIKLQSIIAVVTVLDMVALATWGSIHIARVFQDLPYYYKPQLGLTEAILIVIMAFGIMFGIASVKPLEELQKELEKKIREDERRFPHDILDPNRNKPPNN